MGRQSASNVPDEHNGGRQGFERNATKRTSGVLMPTLPVQQEITDKPQGLEPGLRVDVALSEWLDLTRWLAAFIVLYAHTTNRFLIPVADVPQSERTIGTYVMGFMSGFSHQAVMVFFVLSGYLVGGALISEVRRTAAIDVTNYLIKRFARLWTVLLPAFVLSFVCFALSIWVYDAFGTGFFTPEIARSGSLSTLSCNIAFLQTVSCGQFAGNGPLWSLFNEFWYYVVFVVFMLGFIQKNTILRIALWVTAAATLLLLSSYQFDGSKLAPYFLIWIMGAGATMLPRPLIRSTILSAIILILILIAMRLSIRRYWWDAHPLGAFIVDFAVSACFCNLIISLKFAKLVRPPLRHWNTLLAGFSFSLYCIHVPILNVIAAARAQSVGLQAIAINPGSMREWLYIMWPMGGAILIAYYFSHLTEWHTPMIKRLMEKIIVKIRTVRLY
ncbi:acyltransferase [Nostoc sp. CHAB 5836]|nr:acyltransferase [Nostoc sp. CHAB 5836]